VATIKGNFDWILVRVETDEGSYGLGEAYASHHSPAIKRSLDVLAELIKGEDPRRINRLLLKMGLGNMSGYMVNAISAIEIALWDLLGKILGVPVHALFGGCLRDEVKIYADCHAGQAVTSSESYGGEYASYTPEAYAANAAAMEAKGYSLLKVDFYPDFPGPGDRRISSPLNAADIKHCTRIVEAMRNAVKPDTGLALDLGGGYSVADAIRLAKEIEPYDVEWIEDPVSGADVEGLYEVTHATSIPVLCSYTQLRNMRQLVRDVVYRKAARLLAVDVGNIGGLLEAKKISDLAELSSIPIAVHNIASPLGTTAAAHVSSTFHGFIALEHHAIEVPWWDELVRGGMDIRDGIFRIGRKPGLGVELNEDQVKKHLAEGESYFS
jgi:gluconate/galactonate dehydratase